MISTITDSIVLVPKSQCGFYHKQENHRKTTLSEQVFLEVLFIMFHQRLELSFLTVWVSTDYSVDVPCEHWSTRTYRVLSHGTLPLIRPSSHFTILSKHYFIKSNNLVYFWRDFIFVTYVNTRRITLILFHGRKIWKVRKLCWIRL